jgi:predicted DNA-binding transcriptional regulator AlpA
MATTDDTLERPPATPTRTVAYPPHAVLTDEEVAAWLQVSVRSVQRYPIKRVQLGERTTRFLAKHVYEWLEGRAA